MSLNLAEQIKQNILAWVDCELQQTLLSLKVDVVICIAENDLKVNVIKPYLSVDEALWNIAVKDYIGKDFDFNKITIAVNTRIPARQPVKAVKHKKIANIIAVLTGKGGVGKSTITANLAIELAKQGFRVGVLDADIHGPSQVLMLGGSVKEDSATLAAVCHGVHMVSLGAILPIGQPAAWRGPMASKALLQLYQQTDWPELDFLCVDCPPGTSDILLTLAKDIPLVGGVLVTTPQVASVMDAERAGSLMKKLQVPILGVIENMAKSACPACGHDHAVFGENGGSVLAKRLDADFWGSIPLLADVCDSSEAGAPIALTKDLFAVQVVKLTQSLLSLAKFKRISAIKVSVSQA